ncbi:MAG: hypothetical protein WD738_19530 [Pirellulales bacterium]
MESGTIITWAGVEDPQSNADVGCSVLERIEFIGQPADNRLVCATDPFDDFDDDDFDDEFDDDFEEEWDEELPGDADQFEPDEKEAAGDDAGEVEPEFDDEE